MLLQTAASTYDASAAESARTARETCMPARVCAGSHAGPTLVSYGPVVLRAPHRLRNAKLSTLSTGITHQPRFQRMNKDWHPGSIELIFDGWRRHPLRRRL